MKKIILSFSAMLVMAYAAQATVYTVNNQNGFDADFNSLTQAIASSSTGDTLSIEPSSVSYGDALLDKRLYLIGPGHNPDFSPYNAYVSSLSFTTYSGGSIIKGMAIAQVITNAGSVVNDVVISGCQIYSQNPTTFGGSSSISNNWIFEGNVIIAITNGINLNNLGANAIFRNNYIQSTAGNNVVLNCPAGAVFDHNIWVASDNNTLSYVIYSGYSNISITNNIFLIGTNSASPVAAGCPSCLWENNITYAPSITLTSLPGTNFNDIDPNFVNYGNVEGVYSSAFDFHLEDGSIGQNAATDGSDIGIYGGIFNFSPIGADGGTPQIVDFTIATSTAPSGGTITIHLNANGSGN